MPSVTGNAVIGDAYALLNVYLPGEAVSNNDAQLARRLLNRMLSGWRQRALLIPVIARERFDLVADQGSPTNPYTIGPGGDFDTERPPNQNSVVSANLILTATSPEVRVPLALATDTAANANKLPTLTSGQPTGLYYNPMYADDLGTIELWPVPDTSTNDLELFLLKPIADFADLSTSYDVPDGVDECLVYNLAKRLAGPYGRTLSPEDAQIAVASLGVVKRSNTKLFDLANDVTWTAARSTYYNIQTGQ